MKENIMSEELYNKLLKAYSKEVLADTIKTGIRSTTNYVFRTLCEHVLPTI